MNDFKLRIWAKIVAIIDLFFSSVQFLASLSILFLGVGVTVGNIQEVGAWTVLIWVGIAIMLIQIGMGLWAALQLFKATRLEQRPDIAYQLSQNWQTICCVLMLLSLISGIAIESLMPTAINIFIRIIFLCIVSCFMREVDLHIKATRQQLLQNV